jgi:DNA-directed RNA polymerase subunit RPC12/RpoP
MAEISGMRDDDISRGPRCPNCGWTDVRRSMSHGFLDQLIRMIGLVPYRCRSCGERFYRTQREARVTAK